MAHYRAQRWKEEHQVWMHPGDKRWQDWARYFGLSGFGYFCCTVHILPLRILNVSTAHANPTVQLRPESMQTDTCVSAGKVFQGLFSYTFFIYVFSIGTRTTSVQKKESVPLVLPNVWQKPQFHALWEQQVSGFSCERFPLSLVRGILSKKCSVSACWKAKDLCTIPAL